MNAHMETAWKHIRRSPYQAMAAIMIMVVTFLAVSVFSILIIGSSKVISYFESKPQVTAFFHDEATTAQISALRHQLEASGKVASAKYVSKEDALKIYKEQNKSDPLLLDLVTADVLPASLEISTFSLSDLPAISSQLKTNPIVQEVVFQQDVVKTLTSWTNTIRILGVGLIVILSIVSILIMATIIGMKISQKKEEIEVMQLIGATRWYISWPFIYEGMFYGIIGAFVGWLVTSTALLASSPYLASFLQGIPLFPVPWFFYGGLLAGEVILAMLLGWFASLLAVRRYIK